jgi:hypothetical protein
VAKSFDRSLPNSAYNFFVKGYLGVVNVAKIIAQNVIFWFDSKLNCKIAFAIEP